MARYLSDVIATHVGSVFMNTEHFAVSITYSDGSYSVTVPAVVSQTQYEQSDGQSLTRHVYRDYLIQASALILNSVVTKPARHHTITEGSKTYKVASPIGEDVFGYDDENELILRVHTILTATP